MQIPLNESQDAEARGLPAWRDAWRHARFRWGLALGVLVCVLGVSVQARFLTWNETRSGTVLQDPVLALFEARDFSEITFALVWGGLLAGVLAAGRFPHRLSRVLLAYGCLVLVRSGVMYLVPLDPPASIIPLRDPLVEAFCDGQCLTRDLFFSGHTATLFLMHLVQPRGRMRRALLAAALLVAVLTVWQHTHYVVDVLVAPLFAFGCLHLAGLGRSPLRADPHHPAE